MLEVEGTRKSSVFVSAFGQHVDWIWICFLQILNGFASHLKLIHANPRNSLVHQALFIWQFLKFLKRQWQIYERFKLIMCHVVFYLVGKMLGYDVTWWNCRKLLCYCTQCYMFSMGACITDLLSRKGWKGSNISWCAPEGWCERIPYYRAAIPVLPEFYKDSQGLFIAFIYSFYLFIYLFH